ncbi:Uncharacterised protein [Pseudomonas aeruginosa]|nr:Uncharacterised protein [Pseudomonas aeruginosa]
MLGSFLKQRMSTRFAKLRPAVVGDQFGEQFFQGDAVQWIGMARHEGLGIQAMKKGMERGTSACRPAIPFVVPGEGRAFSASC